MDNTGLQVREAAVADLAAVVALVNSAFRGESSKAGWTTEADMLGGVRTDEARQREWIATPGHVTLVREEDGAIIACVSLKRTGDEAYLGMLTTKPTLQARGLGRAMVRAAEAWAATHWGARAVHMTVIVQRPELVAWYVRLGYSETGERQPFPYGDERFGLPKRPDLEFTVLRKVLG